MRLLLTLLLSLFAAQTLATQPNWTLTRNVVALPTAQLRSIPDPSATLPDLWVTYTKAYSKGRSYNNDPAWTAACDFAPALDLSKDARFTCTFQTNAANGWYSGYWRLVLTDSADRHVEYLISGEAWKARKPVFIEQALVGLPPGFDRAHVVKVEVLGRTSTLAQKATVKIASLTFDAQPVREADARRRARWHSLQASAPASASFLIHPISTFFKPDRDDWQPAWSVAKSPSRIALNAARGGHDESQILIFPVKAKNSVQVQRSALIGPGGAKIDPSQVALYQMLWVPTLPAGRPDIYEGWHPDILQPIPNGVVAVNPDVLSDLWIDIHAPRDTKPGLYTGKITLRQGMTTQTIPIRLRVHNLTLPARPTLTTSFWLFPGNLAQYRGVKPEELKFSDYRPYVDMALQNEVTPVLFDNTAFRLIPKNDGTYDVDLSKWENYYGYVMTHGGNVVDLGDTCSFGYYFYAGNNAPVHVPGEMPADAAKAENGAVPPHRLQILKTYLAKEHSFLSAHGWDKFAYLQLYDEASERADVMSIAYPAVKSVSPTTRIAMTETPLPSYARWVDITIPTLPEIDKTADPRRYAPAMVAEGKHPWFYTCVNYGITIPEVAVRERLLPLEAFHLGASGYLFWSLNWYTKNQPSFPATPWDEYRSDIGASTVMGDGTLIYPAAHPGGPLMPSTRLKLYRDGMEDYEFLHALQTLYAKKKNKLTPAQRLAVENVLALQSLLNTAWESPDTVSARRAQAGKWIDKLSSL